MIFVQLIRNFCLIASAAARHLVDDPVLLVVQISRKLPGRLVSKLTYVSRILPARSFLKPLMSLLAGDQTALFHQLTETRETQSPGDRIRLANIAIAGGYPDLGRELMDGVGPATSAAAPTNARLRWHEGDMAGAVKVLEGVPGRRARNMHERLLSEREVFHGWRPTLSPVGTYRPDDNTVLHVLTNSLPHTGSGYAQRTHSILKAQRQLGWNVHAVTRPGYPVQLGVVAARSTDWVDGVVYHRLLPAKLPHGMAARLQLQAEETLQLALVLRPTVLHTTTHFVNALVTAAVAEALGIPWVYEIRGQLADTWLSSRSEGARQSERYQTFVAREVDAMLRADQCATLSRSMDTAITKQVGRSLETLLLPNAVGEAFLEDPQPASEARRQLGLPVEGTYIGTVSSLVGYEGLNDLLAVFDRLAEEDRSLRCLIVGSGAAENALRQQAKESAFSDRIIFTGRVNRSRAHLYHQALDVFVLPRIDSEVTRSVTPLKPVEALASGRPVVFSDLPALHESVTDGAEGIAFRAGDRDGLAKEVASLTRDAQRRQRMGNTGRKRVLDERTWTATALRTTEMYKRLKVS